MKRPNCFQCMYFKVTWEQGAPRACTFHGFKTREIPANVVYRASGMHCMNYRPKRKERYNDR